MSYLATFDCTVEPPNADSFCDLESCPDFRGVLYYYCIGVLIERDILISQGVHIWGFHCICLMNRS